MSDALVRPALEKDLKAAARLAANLVYQHHGFDAKRFFVPDNVEEGYVWWFGKELARKEVALFVAEREGAIVGYAYGRLEERDWNMLLDAHGAFHDIWVEESARRTGVAEKLARAVIEALEAKGAPRVVLGTAASNEIAQRFFARLGFRRTMIEMTRESSE